MPRLMMHPATWMKYPYCSLCGYFLTLSRMFFLFCFFLGNTPLFHRQEHTQAHYQSISLTMTAFHLNVQFQGHVIVHAGSHEQSSRTLHGTLVYQEKFLLIEKLFTFRNHLFIFFLLFLLIFLFFSLLHLSLTGAYLFIQSCNGFLILYFFKIN